MKIRSLSYGAAAAALVLSMFVGEAARANSIPVSEHVFFSRDQGATFFSASQSFFLPSNAINVQLNTESFAVDDSSVIRLNGTDVLSTGIGAPGTGSFQFSAGGSPVSYNFLFGDNIGPLPAVTSPFILGANNTLDFYLNNTGNGITGPVSAGGGPSNLDFTGSVTFQLAPAPAPGVGLLSLLIMLAGAAVRRRNILGSSL